MTRADRTSIDEPGPNSRAVHAGDSAMGVSVGHGPVYRQVDRTNWLDGPLPQLLMPGLKQCVAAHPRLFMYSFVMKVFMIGGGGW